MDPVLEDLNAVLVIPVRLLLQITHYQTIRITGAPEKSFLVIPQVYWVHHFGTPKLARLSADVDSRNR